MNSIALKLWPTSYTYKRPYNSIWNCAPYEFVMTQNNTINNQILALKVD